MLPFNAGWSSLVILAIGLLSTCLLRATAQETSAVCLSQYDWMDNSKNQNHCLVAAYVQGVCSDGQFTVDPLAPGAHYIGPYGDNANACTCNTVTYSLLRACSICQNRTYISWSSWSLYCSTVYVGYPESISDDTAIPQWAYEDVTASGATLVQAARDSFEGTAILNSSEETTIFYSSEGITILGGTTIVGSTVYTTALGPSPTPSPSSSTLSTSRPSSSASPAPSTSSSASPAPSTSSSTPSTPSPSSSTSLASSPSSSSSTSSTSSPSTSKSNNVGAIVGGVVGGAVGLIVTAIVARILVSRCRRQRRGMPDATRVT